MSENRAIPIFIKRSEDKGTQAREEMRHLLEVLIQKMVGETGGISVRTNVGERTTVFIVDCGKPCMGRLIGAGGRNIMGLRHVVTAIMASSGIRAVIEIPYYPDSKS